MRLNTRISALLMALIAVGARERWAFTVLLVLAAAAYGLANPSANQALADHAPLHRGATIFGIKHAGIPGSTLLAGLAVPVVVLNLGWRAAYVAAAVLALAVSLLVPSGEMPAPVHEDVAEPGQPWKRRDLVGLAVGGGLATLAAVALGSYLVSAAVDLGFSQGGAGWLQFAGSGLSILTRVGLGWLTDRTQTTGMSLMVGLIVAGAAVFYLLPISSGFGFAAAVMIAFSTAWAWPGLMTHVVVNRDRRSAAVASGISQTGIFVGAGLAPLLLGTVIQRWSFDRAFLLVAVSLTLSAIVLVWVGRTAAAVRQK
jgi:predicted MFS family arabinose efflux permease